MKNIMFSTTRQWNCGDEFILFGVRNIVDALIGSGYNSLIYNRNPSVRPAVCGGSYSLSRPIKSIKKYIVSSVDECDNSFHKRIDFDSVIDAAFCAGTPEWYGNRMRDFYNEVRRGDIPLYILGAGSFPDNFDKYLRLNERDIIERAKVLTFRTKDLAEKAQKSGLLKAKYIPCPALLSATKEHEKLWSYDTSERTIGLGFNICSDDTVPSIGLSKEAYDFSLHVFDSVLKRYSKSNFRFVGICHYIDELPFARKFFARYNVPVVYSYNSQDYFAIYSNIDLLVSTRVHGCGICASMGIPSLGISHDYRGGTMNGFLSEVVTLKDDISDVMYKLDKLIDNLSCKHDLLLAHKERVMSEYMGIFKGVELFS